MIEGNRKLLLKDLCARQMHNVKCRVKYSFNNETTNGRDVWTEDDDTIKMVNPEYEEVFISYISEWVDIENVKPYLRPMKSMTEKEKEEFYEISGLVCYDGLFSCKKLAKKQSFIADTIDWLNQHHFDYRGLIPKGLALEAPEGMYEI